MKLKVRSAHDSDTYLDFARIPRDYRKNERHQPLGRGEVCRVFCVETGKEWFVILHGAPAKLGATIRIDEHVRQKLGVHRDEEYDFRYCPKVALGAGAYCLPFRLLGQPLEREERALAVGEPGHLRFRLYCWSGPLEVAS